LLIFFFFFLRRGVTPQGCCGRGHAVRTEHKLASLSSIAFFLSLNSNKPHGKERTVYSSWKHGVEVFMRYGTMETKSFVVWFRWVYPVFIMLRLVVLFIMS
jgi:hypothetical protein